MTEFKKYKLFYKEYEIGIVTELSDEWPRPSGIIKLSSTLKELNEETKLLYDYFDFSIKAAAILENGSDEDYQEFCSNNEYKYLEMIESEEWFLLDHSGNKINVAIPVLAEHNEIIWTALKE